MNSRNSLSTALLVFGLLYGPILASATPSANFESKMAQASQQNKSLSCSFTQSKKVKNFKNIITSTGQLFFDQQGRMALCFDQPEGDKITIIGEQFSITSGGKTLVGKASDNPLMMQVCQMLKACMTGDISQLGRGWDKKLDEGQKEFLLILTPSDRRTSKHVASLVLRFDKSNMTLKDLQMNLPTGEYTHYQFTKKKLNTPIDPALFL